MDPVELKIHRRNTKAFIDADPIEITLHRKTRTRNDAGGFIDDVQPIAVAQTFRLLPVRIQSDRMPELKTSSGRLVHPVYVLLAEFNADLQRWDAFELNGVWFEIASPIRPEHTTTSIYELKGDVVRREDS